MALRLWEFESPRPHSETPGKHGFFSYADMWSDVSDLAVNEGSGTPLATATYDIKTNVTG